MVINWKEPERESELSYVCGETGVIMIINVTIVVANNVEKL